MMDSITQVTLGCAIGEVCLGPASLVICRSDRVSLPTKGMRASQDSDVILSDRSLRLMTRVDRGGGADEVSTRHRV